jgi:pimeloyl-ACP methyl ester carboxylesterase
MGAATSLLHGERDPSIAGMILDSAFADLVMLAEEMVEKGRQQGLFAPTFLVKIAIKFVRSSVLKSAGFDIKALSPIEHVDKCFIPALFVAGENDNFVMPTHSKKLHDKYGGDKNFIIVEGDHNTPRPRYLFDAASIFLQTVLQVRNSDPRCWTVRFRSLSFSFPLSFSFSFLS